jgi:hypothetical protein
MAWFNKRPDPISERERAINEEIADLEAQIKELEMRAQQRESSSPRLRSTAVPQSATMNNVLLDSIPLPPTRPAPEPIFEEVDLKALKDRAETPGTPQHYNDLGVRKYDLPALFGRLRNHFRGPSTTNPKLVSYLAAGGIQGLRPLRYEKRIARNRFVFLVAFLFLMLLGLIAAFVKHR